jgi:hypothetical protein
MKTTKTLLLLSAFAALAGSCSNDEALQPEEKQPIVVRATTEYTEVPATRTIFGDVAPTDGSTLHSVSLEWNEDETSEKIDVAGFNSGGYLYNNVSTTFYGLPDTRSTDGKSMSFEVTSYPTTDEGKYAYLYPSGAFNVETYVIESKQALIETQTQSGYNSLTHLSASNLMYSEWRGAGEAFTLKPATAILRFDLTFPEAVTTGKLTLRSSRGSAFQTVVKIEYYTGTAVLSHATSTASQSITIAGIEDPTDKLTVYMMTGAGAIPAGMESDMGVGGVTLTLEAAMKDAESGSDVTYERTLGTTKSDARFLPGKCYNFTVASGDWKY